MFTNNPDSNQCFFTTGMNKNNNTIKIKCIPHIPPLKCEILWDWLITNKFQYQDLISIHQVNPNLENIKKEYIYLIETGLLYKKCLLPILKNKKRFEITEKEKEFYREKKYFWENKDFIILPHPFKSFPIYNNLTAINKNNINISDINLICLYIGKEDLYSIRELNSSHLSILNELETKIYNIARDEFKIEEDKVRIYAIHNPASIPILHFEVSFFDNTFLSSDYKWRMDSKINIKIIKELIEYNKIENYVFSYGTQKRYIELVPYKYVELCKTFWRNKVNVEKLNICLNELIDKDLKKYYFKQDEILYRKKKHKNDFNTILEKYGNILDEKIIYFLFNCEYIDERNKINITNEYINNTISLLKNIETENNFTDMISVLNNYNLNQCNTITDYIPHFMKKENCIIEFFCKKINSETKYIIRISPKEINYFQNEFGFEMGSTSFLLYGNQEMDFLFGSYHLCKKKIYFDIYIYEKEWEELPQMGVVKFSNPIENYKISREKFPNNIKIPKQIKDETNEHLIKIKNKYSAYKISETTYNNDYGNFLILINWNAHETPVELQNTDKDEPDYSKIIKENKAFEFIAWHYHTDDSKILHSIYHFINENKEDNTDKWIWMNNQLYQISDIINSLLKADDKYYLALYVHYPTIAFPSLHYRIRVIKNISTYYNRNQQMIFNARNLNLDTILLNKHVSTLDIVGLPQYVQILKKNNDIQEGGEINKHNDFNYKQLNLDQILEKYQKKLFFFGLKPKQWVEYSITIFKDNIYNNNLYDKFIKTEHQAMNALNQFNLSLYIIKYVKYNIFKSYLKKYNIPENSKKIALITNQYDNRERFNTVNYKNLKVIELDIYNLKLQNINEKYKLIFCNYRSKFENISYRKWIFQQFQYQLSLLIWSLEHIEDNAVICIQLGLTCLPCYRDLILLCSQYSTIFVLSDYRISEVTYYPVFYILSDFWKLNILISELKKIQKFNLNENTGFFKMKNSLSLSSSIKDLNEVNQYFMERSLVFRSWVKSQANTVNMNDIKKVQKFSLMQIINDKIPNKPKNTPYIIKTLNSKIIRLNDGKQIKLHSGINYDEGKYLYNLIIKENMKKIIEVGFAYGISSMFIIMALKNNDKNTQLISIDPFQSSQWNNIGIYNISQISKDKSIHKLYEDFSYNVLPQLLKENEKSKTKYDMVFIDGWHTFDYALIDVFYSIMITKIGGYLILDDALHPGVSKLINFIDTNFNHLQKVVSNIKTLGIYKIVNKDSRTWDFHKHFG